MVVRAAAGLLAGPLLLLLLLLVVVGGPGGGAHAARPPPHGPGERVPLRLRRDGPEDAAAGAAAAPPPPLRGVPLACEFANGSAVPVASHPWCDTGRGVEERLGALVEALTLEEKLKLMTAREVSERGPRWTDPVARRDATGRLAASANGGGG